VQIGRHPRILAWGCERGAERNMAWNLLREPLRRRDGVRIELTWNSWPASFSNVIAAWRDDADFRSFFNQLLADSPYSAFRWETPPVKEATRSRTFEFVLLDSPGLARRPDPQPFADHFQSATDGVVMFRNLGGDAVLIVPCPTADAAVYGHLGAFVRGAPESQRQALWRKVGEAMQQRVSAAPVWLSTAGAGVSWLHVRLDDRPKFYGHQPYTQDADSA
jgi:hypothetical protein